MMRGFVVDRLVMMRGFVVNWLLMVDWFVMDRCMVNWFMMHPIACAVNFVSNGVVMMS